MRYAGFWLRLLASLIDGLIIVGVTFLLIYLVYGVPYIPETAAVSWFELFFSMLVNYIFPLLYTFFFWLRYGGTPGKLLLGLKVVDAAGGGNISFGQAVLRYIGYFVSTMGLLIGYFWIAFDRRKQGWHDKMARTVVIRV